MYKYDISKVCKPFTQDQLVEGRLYLCIYYANTSLKIPFIQYLLYKYNDGPLKHNLIIPFIVLLTVVVFVHEYGHYYFAKKYGVGVTDFSIGFGKEIFGFNDKSGTRWKFCLIPLGLSLIHISEPTRPY